MVGTKTSLVGTEQGTAERAYTCHDRHVAECEYRSAVMARMSMALDEVRGPTEADPRRCANP